MIKKNKNLKNIILVTVVLILIGLIVLVVKNTFGYFNYMKKGEILNVISIKGIEVEIINDSENNLNINEAYPMYDDEGMLNDPFTFTLRNTSSKVLDIVLKIENDTDKQGSYPLLSTNYIRYSYKVGNEEYSEPRNLGANNNIILSDTITRNEIKTISVKLWIDKDAPNEVQGKYFFGQLIVEGTKSLCTLEPGDVFNFDYTGSVQEFDIDCPGYYKLETWGAQGGEGYNSVRGGYGAYATGMIQARNETLYINVGGMGVISANGGGYNGGGNQPSALTAPHIGGGGGGATHIALSNGLLSELEQYKGELVNNQYYESNSIIIVAAGGGGSYSPHYGGPPYGGSGGGIIGVNGACANDTGYGTGGSQISAGINNRGYTFANGSFGQGGSGSNEGAGGAGFFGGASGHSNYGCGGGGGSSYIANPNLINKHMTCFNCTTSNDTETKTISNTCYNSTPTADCAKEGNGYARITYLGEIFNTTLYGAASDEIYFNNSNNEKVVLGTTDSNGRLENVVIPLNIPIYSTIAKDLNDLSKPYSKTFTAPSATTYLMPEGNIAYWYGNNIGNCTGVTTTTHGGTRILFEPTSIIVIISGSPTSYISKVYCDAVSVDNYNTTKMVITRWSYNNTGGVRYFGLTTSTAGNESFTAYGNISSDSDISLVSQDISSQTGSQRISYATHHNNGAGYNQDTIYALWYE